MRSFLKFIVGAASIVLALSLFVPPAYAVIYEVANPEITGSFANNSFDLSSEGVMFQEGIYIVPGDELHTTVDIKNDMKVSMKVKLDSVEIVEPGNSFDQALCDAMQVEIKYNDEVLYFGPWKGSGKVQTRYLEVPSGKTIKMDFKSWLPLETGNAAQGGKVETVWNFVAETEGEKAESGLGHGPIKEGISDSPTEIVMLAAFALIVANLGFLVFPIASKRDKQKEKQ